MFVKKKHKHVCQKCQQWDQFGIPTEQFPLHHASLASSSGWLVGCVPIRNPVAVSKLFSNKSFVVLLSHQNTRWTEVSSWKHSCIVFSQTEVNSDRPCGKHQEFLFLFPTNYLSDLCIIFSPERVAGTQSKQTALTVGCGQSAPSTPALLLLLVAPLSGFVHNSVCQFINCCQIL